MAVRDVDDVWATLVAMSPSKLTQVRPVNPDPWMVTCSPPCATPELGLTPVMVGKEK